MCIRATEAYHAYFGMPVGDHDKRWAPQVICEYCRHTLEGWLIAEKKAMRFATPRTFQSPLGLLFLHGGPIKRRKGKNAPPIEYPTISSSIAPVPHNTSNLPVPNLPTKAQQMVAVESSEDSEMEEGEPSSLFGLRRRQRSRDERCPYYPNQKDINDLIREMALNKWNAELLVSRLKQWDLLDNGVRITSQRKRHYDFFRFFSLQDKLCYCHDVRGLFQAIGIPCNTIDWRLFIDSSSRSLKALLLRNTNQCPSISLAHCVVIKETYQTVKALLDALNFAQYE